VEKNKESSKRKSPSRLRKPSYFHTKKQNMLTGTHDQVRVGDRTFSLDAYDTGKTSLYRANFGKENGGGGTPRIPDI
jgi:hypothetical protein